MQHQLVPWSGIPPMGGRTKAPRTVTVGISPSDLDLTLAFYDAVFSALGVTPEDQDDCRIWGTLLLVRRGTRDRPTTGADVFLEAEDVGEIDAVVAAVKAAGFSTSDFVAEANEEHHMTWVRFPDPDGNRIWITFTAS